MRFQILAGKFSPMNAVAEKISAFGAAAACAVAMASGAAHAQTGPEPAATASINRRQPQPQRPDAAVDLAPRELPGALVDES